MTAAIRRSNKTCKPIPVFTGEPLVKTGRQITQSTAASWAMAHSRQSAATSNIRGRRPYISEWFAWAILPTKLNQWLLVGAMHESRGSAEGTTQFIATMNRRPSGKSLAENRRLDTFPSHRVSRSCAFGEMEKGRSSFPAPSIESGGRRNPDPNSAQTSSGVYPMIRGRTGSSRIQSRT